VVMITSGRDERGFATVAGCEFESKHAAIKPKRSLKVCDFQVHMTDAHIFTDWPAAFHWMVSMVTALVYSAGRRSVFFGSLTSAF
jgi:hypothetical protein